MPKLTDTQLIILSTATQRDDGAALPLPKSLKLQGGVVSHVLKSLLKKGLLDEQPTRDNATAWRESKDGQRLTLVITAAGRQAIGVSADEQRETPATAPRGSKRSVGGRRKASESKGATRPSLKAKKTASPAGLRAGTKLDAGPIFWDAKYAKKIMATYRDFLTNAPEELGFFVGLKTVPSMDPFPREAWGKRACALISCFNGSEEDGKNALAPLLGKLPSPYFNWMSTMPFPAMQGLFDPFFPKGLQWYWKGDFVTDLPDEAIEVYIAESAKAPSELSLMHLYPIDGAVHRVGKDETAWGARGAKWSMVIAGIDSSPRQAGALVSWGRAYWTAVHQFNPGGAYINFMMDDEGEARVKASYGDNYGRLAAVKKKYDPANLFRVNQNIKPSA
jgi:hypothetical protein